MRFFILKNLNWQKSNRKSNLAGLTILLLLSLLLGACSASSPSVVTATPAQKDIALTQAAVIPTITPLPPLPTNTPRPTLQPTSGSVKPSKADMVKAAFQALIGSYFYPLNSANVYEIALRGMKNYLQDNGINDPQVPIPDFSGDLNGDWQLFLQAYTLTLEKYQSQIGEEPLAYGAVQAATSSLGECRTGFYPPANTDDLIQNVAGTAPALGLGIIVVAPAGGEGLYISRVVPGSPADKAGLKTGDSIRGVGGQSIVGMSIGTASRLLVGGDKPTPGTQVSIEIKRAVTGKTEQLQITRGSTQVQTFERQIIGNVGYLRINSFPNRSQLTDLNLEFDNNLSELSKQNVKGLVIDLRGTRYGNYSTVRSFLSRFVQDNGLLIMSGRNAQGKFSALQMNSIPGVTVFNKPLAVLVDGTTAAEAELFSYALQLKKTARLFGQPTAGCLVGSDLVRMPDSSILNLAIFRVIQDPTQLDSVVDRVIPDEVVDMELSSLNQGKDSILEKALAYIQSL